MSLAVAEGFEPSHGRINSAVPYQLGYATAIRRGDGDGETRGRGEKLVIYHWTVFICHLRRTLLLALQMTIEKCPMTNQK